MAEVLTIAEIEARFDSEWILIEDCDCLHGQDAS